MPAAADMSLLANVGTRTVVRRFRHLGAFWQHCSPRSRASQTVKRTRSLFHAESRTGLSVVDFAAELRPYDLDAGMSKLQTKGVWLKTRPAWSWAMLAAHSGRASLREWQRL